jgi:glycosyltransferase involved in cell wall biosynthesis
MTDDRGRDRVAVVTRTRDRPLLLARAIASVLGQTHQDWVHVIVNDGGDRATVDALVARHATEYAGRVQVLHHAAALGMEAASNAGIAASDSVWVAIHDDDDSWHPAFLARTLAAIHAHTLPDCRGAVAWSLRIVERIDAGRITELRREDYNGTLRRVELWRLLQQNLFPPISFIFAREAFEAVGGFDPTLPVLGDWDFNVRFCTRFEIVVVPEYLAYYHHRPAGTGGAYANTVVEAAGRHADVRAWLINRWLRQDIAAGRVGIGVLAAIGDDLHGLRRHAELPRRILRAARRRVLRWLRR